MRTFEHKDGFIINILEDTQTSKLKWINEENTLQKSLIIDSFDDENFNKLPPNVQLFLNTLRSLQGKSPLFNSDFDLQYQKLWKKTIKERQACKDTDLPDIFLFDSVNSDEIWDILNSTIDSSFADDNIIKYIGTYFWFAFVNDPRDENENPHLLITPKGFFDDGRIPMIFDESQIDTPILKGLEEIMESTIEITTDSDNPIEKLRIAYQKMQNLGIQFSYELQKEQISNYQDTMPDFLDTSWIKNNLENKKISKKYNK